MSGEKVSSPKELALDIKGLRKVYGKSTVALDTIDLQVEAGEFRALLGPNGAGKSTAIGIICGLVNKTAGKVKVFGVDLDESPSFMRLGIGVVPQEFNFGAFEKVADILVTQGGYYGLSFKKAQRRAAQCLELLGLTEKGQERARMLSGGMKRRLMIARALVHNPGLLILDEPTAGVDVDLRHSIWEFLRQFNAQGNSVLLTTHYLEEAEHLCRKVAIIDHGRIVEDATMSEVLRKLDSLVYLLSLDTEAPEDLNIPGVQLLDVQGHDVRVSVPTTMLFHELAGLLKERGLRVTAVRESGNRLEAFFLSRTSRAAESSF